MKVVKSKMSSMSYIMKWFGLRTIFIGFASVLIFTAAVAQYKMSHFKSTAYKQSFGLFTDISEPMWNQMRDTVKLTSWYANPQNPLDKVDEETLWLANNLNPNFHCPHVERVGKGEGVKFLCNPQRLIREEKKDCLVYSIGCAGDFNFEDAMSKKYNKECEIHVFDPADWTRKDDIKNRNIHYHPWGLVSTYDLKSKSVVWPKGRGGGFKTFQESLEILGHKDRTIDILKIDCEGCEWSTHKDWIQFGFRQILVEIHGVPQPKGGNGRWYKAPMNITDYFQDFRDNGYALFNRDSNGKLAVELSFLKLNEDFYKK
mmetsp:Transcript_1154/g.2523  ORF Transcript_1154/g.2523 Transcript_1154/m.2523 type:complete len:315 (-) Transcript_1154:260-1204(-)|eukprot:CAMPEP_0194304734 /NCGR_PEP_ID=MMETSP0171-20130528/2383_1 /TAXON_ID=218684 /ORGANISM="Corethron pennatum, Strain L29A3" /LENGTH=314 /DNA_ID=CAMNT_0039056079 /DNA_START=39 /DNA_END=983 /DNA_ORIENTATION=-